MPARRLDTKIGLSLVCPTAGPWRLEWEGVDWLGPLGIRVHREGRLSSGPSPLAAVPTEAEGEDDLGPYTSLEAGWQPAPLPIVTTVRAYRDRGLFVFRIEAARDLEGLATGEFGEPSVAWPWLRPAERAPGPLSEEGRAFGYQFTEFAFPTWSDASMSDFFQLPHRPAVVGPLWLMGSDRCVMLAPLDRFHEQVIAVPHRGERSERGVRCGWQGDLDVVPRGFSTELALWGGSGPRPLMEGWGELLLRRHGTRRPSRYADGLLSRLSYWTDNGAAYWYRTEPGCTVTETLERTVDGLRRADVPFHALQLDSWFYPHEKSRPLNAPEADVPPTGMTAWEPRPDMLPEGIVALRRRLGNPPLVLHSRHFSSRSPYFERGASWTDGDRAHPSGPELLERLIAQAADWGAITYEQDWLVESFMGVRGLRERPGRAREWQEGMDRAAAEHGLTLQWCMGSPADFLQTLTLERVTSIRTSGDYRYKVGSGFLWTWFLLTNAFARALGLLPFKDVFLSRTDGSGRDGDPHAEAEALLSALSAGPVGIGDRAGRTDRDLVLRTCRRDGVLVKPDVPIAALDRCFGESPFMNPTPLIGETGSAHPAGRWVYLASFNACHRAEPIRFRIDLADLGAARPEGPVVVYDWRTGSFDPLDPDGGLEISLDPLDWDLRVLCPLLPAGLTLFGDVTKYASVGDRRIRAIRAIAGGVEFEVLGAPGERIEVHGQAASRIVKIEQRREATGGWEPLPDPAWSHQRSTGRLALAVEPGASGRVEVRVRSEGVRGARR